MSTEYRYDPETGSFRPTQRRQEQSDWGGWALIAFFFLTGLWPLGLFFLISKLNDTPTHRPAAKAANDTKIVKAAKSVTRTPAASDKTAKILTIVGAAVTGVFGIGLLSTIGEMLAYGGLSMLLEDVLPLTGFVAGGVATFLAGRKMKKRQNRITRYLAVIGERDYITIDELAAVVGQNTKTVEADLEFMIEKGKLGIGAYVDAGRGILFRSADAYQRYLTKRTEKENLTPKEANEGYAGALRAIRQANDRIPDPVFSKKLDHMEEVAGKIFREVEAHPEKQKQASTFLNYYLPTTLKLLATYTEFEDAGIEGENLRQAKSRIESIMDTLVEQFDRQLDELYRSEAMDVDSDIRVMENMLARDLGSVEKDFGLGGTAAVQRPEDME